MKKFYVLKTSQKGDGNGMKSTSLRVVKQFQVQGLI